MPDITISEWTARALGAPLRHLAPAGPHAFTVNISNTQLRALQGIVDRQPGITLDDAFFAASFCSCGKCEMVRQ